MQRQHKQRTFVLVHGAWHGGWCWTRVAEPLRARGHRVFTPTLTGLGERAHLLSGRIDLQTHVTDVVNVIKWEDLNDVVLVGHSYAGWVISGVVEEVAAAVRCIVYLDAFFPEDGQRGLDLQPEPMRQAILAAIERGEIARPVPKPEFFDVNEADRAWVASKLTPHPIGVGLTPLRLTGARERVPVKAYIRATGSERPSYDATLDLLRKDPGWRLYDVPCGHDVMIDMPDRLVEVLAELSALSDAPAPPR
jgi:pimeloyl-ACP methyl ester carboxylesterase